MKYRKLRIAWSVACGVALLLLVVLWVRSYWTFDSLNCTDLHGRYVVLQSCLGGTAVAIQPEPQPQEAAWDISLYNDGVGTVPVVGSAFQAYRAGGGVVIICPHWSLAIATVGLTAAPWLKLRFSLRTLLIGMTVAAIGLGAVVYLLK